MTEDLQNVPIETGNIDSSGITKIISSYEPIIISLKINLLAKKLNENGELVPDPTRRPILGHDAEKLFFSRLESAISTPVRFSQHDHEQARQILINNVGKLRFDLIEMGVDERTVNTLVDVYDRLVTATLNGSIEGFTLHQITEHMNINELRTPNAEKKGGGIMGLFKRKGGNEQNV